MCQDREAKGRDEKKSGSEGVDLVGRESGMEGRGMRRI